MEKATNHTLSPRFILTNIIYLTIVPALPILIAWKWNWWQAWVYVAINILGFIGSRYLAAKRHPDLLAERAASMKHANTKPWDRILAPLVGLGAMSLPLIAGLEARRQTALAFSLWLQLLAIVVLLLGFVLSTWALVENKFFSGVVRIQTDRGHHVVSGGPYKYIRHPGYAGAVLAYFAIPLLLDSRFSFIPAVFLIIILAIRTILEERALKEELPGYSDYMKRVSFRWIPWIF